MSWLEQLHYCKDPSQLWPTKSPFTESCMEEFFRQQQPTKAAPFVLNYQVKLSEEWNPVDISILLTLLAIGAFLIYRFSVWKMRVNSSEIWAQIVDQNDTVMIRLMDLAYPNSLYRLTAQDFVNRVMIKGIIFQVVKIIWPGLQIKHRVLSKVLTLPSIYVVNPLKGMRLARILASRYEFLLFAKDCGSKKYK